MSLDVMLKPGDDLTIILFDAFGVERDRFRLSRADDAEPEVFHWAAFLSSDEYNRGSGTRAIGGATRLDQKKTPKEKK